MQVVVLVVLVVASAVTQEGRGTVYTVTDLGPLRGDAVYLLSVAGLIARAKTRASSIPSHAHGDTTYDLLQTAIN
jgi:hypothetical protein